MMNQNKIIGRVLAVDNFRVFIKIEEELKGSYKSGVNDIYEVARINSYLIIPVGSDRIVALITRVTMKEEMELDKNTTSITLPTSSRYISATMLGTIIQKNEKECFIQGVYSFPALDNPVWYVTEKDLNHIFDNKTDKEICYQTDFYLPIGTSPAFQNYKVKICPDQLFVKHAAILGNTGSGKSCTLTSILRNLFRYNYNGKKLINAHFVIFDTNGEYKSAFQPDEFSNKIEEQELKQINAYYYGGEDNVKVPYWLMNWQDFKALLKPSDGTQAPILNRAIGLAKNEQEALLNSVLPVNLQSEIEKIIELSDEDLKKRTGESSYGNWKWKTDNEIQKIGEAVKKIDDSLGSKIIELSNLTNYNNAALQQPIRDKIKILESRPQTSKKIIQMDSQINNVIKNKEQKQQVEKQQKEITAKFIQLQQSFTEDMDEQDKKIENLKFLQNISVCPDCQSKMREVFSIVNTSPKKLSIYNTELTPKQFDELVAVVTHQNILDYDGDKYIDPNLKKDMELKQRLENKNYSSPSLEKMLVCISISSPYTMEELKENITLRKLSLMLKTIDAKNYYYAQIQASMSGFVEFKKEPTHWIFGENKKDMSKEIMSMNDLQQKFASVT